MFELHENGGAGKTYFHMNGFAQIVVLIQRQNVTRKLPIEPQYKHSISGVVKLFFNKIGN